MASADAQAQLRSAATYGGPSYQPPGASVAALAHRHFGPVIVSCERGALRPMPDGVWLYGDSLREHRSLAAPAVPRFEVIDELIAALRLAQAPIHDGPWARATLEVCLGVLNSVRGQCDVELTRQPVLPR